MARYRVQLAVVLNQEAGDEAQAVRQAWANLVRLVSQHPEVLHKYVRTEKLPEDQPPLWDLDVHRGEGAPEDEIADQHSRLYHEGGDVFDMYGR